MQQNHQWNDCFNFRILRRVCIKGGRGGGGGKHVDHTIMVYDLELFVGLFLLFFLPVCVFVTIFSVLLQFFV